MVTWIQQFGASCSGVRAATVDFKSVSAAEDARYVEFLDCFDSPFGDLRGLQSLRPGLPLTAA
jgi:hypothetical protein